MKKTAWILLLMLWIVVPSGAAEFEHPSANYRVEIPSRWQKRVASGVLQIAVPGGLKIRVEYELSGEKLDESEVQKAFRTDGKRLKNSFGAVRVSRRPDLSEENELGGTPTYRYGIQYKPKSRGLHVAEGYVASGTSLWPRKELQIKMLIYGSLRAFQASREDLDEFLDSFTWPHVAGTEPTPRRPRRPVRKDPPAPTQVAVAPVATRPAEPVLPDQRSDRGSGSSDGFQRGSRRGGSLLFRNETVSHDQEWNRKYREAFGPKDGDRSEAQQAASAARMGFRED